jgi:L-ascorbate metabolism protein UlaG (beta-lactamase superfamily)
MAGFNSWAVSNPRNYVKDEAMEIQLIRSATLRITYDRHVFLIDPYLAPKYSQEPLIGKSRNPLVDLPIPAQEVLADVEMLLVSHLHPDHFDDLAQQLLPRRIQVFCQPEDEGRIKAWGFSNIVPVKEHVEWYGMRITRTIGQHGNESWAPQMGSVSGFIFRAQNEPTIYWAGDTIWFEGLKQLVLETDPDIIITHSSGASFETGKPIIMDAKQTIAVCRTAPRAIVIATHMETFDFDTVSRKDLRTMAEAEKIGAEQLLIPADGDTLAF